MSRQIAALSSATQHAMPPEFDGKWRTGSVLTLGSPYLLILIYILYYILYNTKKYLYEVKILFTPENYTLCMYASNILHSNNKSNVLVG